jgi:hypothetical protein
MADTYALCPCGSGDKIKHCCARPLQGELVKILDSLVGGQPAAAIQRIDQLLQKNPDDPCLLSVQMQVNYPRQASAEERQRIISERVTHMQRVAPNHVTSLTGALMLSAMERREPSELTAALESLLARINSLQFLPMFAREILMQTAIVPGQNGLVSVNRVMTIDYVSRAFGPEDAENDLLARLLSDSPTMLREDWLARFLADAENGGDMELTGEMVERAISGLWSEVIGELEKLQTLGQHRAEVYGLMAWLLTAQNKVEEAASWWDRYASHPEVSSFAAALAAYNSCMLTVEPIVFTEFRWEVADYAAVNQSLVANTKIVTSLDIPAAAAKAYSPPPRLRFIILDRAEVPLTEIESTPSRDFPRVVGNGFLFGKETDREARIAFSGAQHTNATATEIVKEAIGEWLTGEPETTNADRIHSLIGSVPSIWIPERTTPAKQQAYERDYTLWLQKEGILDVPSPILEGHAPNVAVKKDVDATRREAYFWAVFFDLGMAYNDRITIDAMRETLGLTPIPAAKGTDLDVQLQWNAVPFADWTQAPAEDLVRSAIAAVSVGNVQSLNALTDEILRRATADADAFPNTDLHELIEGLLRQRFETIGAGTDAIEWIDNLLELKERLSIQEGQWLINRWVLMMATENETGAHETWTRLQPLLSDPQVAQRVQGILIQMGVLNPDGTPRNIPQPAAAAPAEGLWTPDSPGGGGEEGGGKLWLPGQ